MRFDWLRSFRLRRTVTRRSVRTSLSGQLFVAAHTEQLEDRALLAAVNDDFADRIEIDETSTHTETNVDATKETGEPEHTANTGGASLWWTWTATVSGSVRIDTFGSSIDTLLAVYTGDAVDDLTEVASNNDSGGETSLVEFDAVAGETYQIAVDGFMGETGDVTLNFSAPANDNFANATLISGSTITVTGNLIEATRETDEPLHAGKFGGKSIWWAWTAPSPGTVTIDTFGSVPDTLLAVYTGTSVDTLDEVASNDDIPEDISSRVQFSVVAGTTYFIAVDGLNGDADEVTLNLSFQSSGPGAPEIAVENEDGANISDGDTTPRRPDGTDFGDGVQGEQPPESVFIVRNTGTQALTLGVVQVPEGFTLVEGLSASIAAGQSDTFTVRLDTTTVGVKSGTISFTNNDANENPYDFAITGRVLAPPDITVLGNNQSITDGDTTPSSQDHTSFGTTVIDTNAVDRVFTVKNDGAALLMVESLQVPTGFTIVEGLGATIAAGASDTITIRMAATTVGVKTGEVKITTSDPDEDEFTFTISGEVLPAPEIAVTGNNVDIVDDDATPSTADGTDFGVLRVGGPAVERTFTVQNTGGAPLNLGTVSLPSGFTIVEGLSSTIAANSSDTFTIRLNPTSAGTKAGQISFTTNDTTESPFNFSIRAVVDGAHPTAKATLPKPVWNAANYTFTVVFADNGAVDVSTLSTAGVIRVAGPNGFLQNAQFVSVNDNTNGTPRTATYQFTPPGGKWNSADNGAYTISIVGGVVKDVAGNSIPAGTLGTLTVLLNDPPVVNVGPASPTYTENGAPLLISSAATVSDVDSPNLGGGKLTLSYASGGTSTDRLTILHQGTGAGQVGVSGTNLTFGGVAIGTFTGGVGTAPLVVTFNTSASPAVVQAVVRRIAYHNISDAPSTTPRAVNYVLTDGDGGTSTAVQKTVKVTAVNDAPVVNVGTAIPVYAENAAPLLISSLAAVTDPDSLDFANGKLTLSYVSGGISTDRLTILHQGTGTGQVGVSGANVTFGGVVVATTAGGVGTVPFVVTFKAAATREAVQAVVRRIAFQNISDNPGTTQRVINFVLTDGDPAGTSAAVQKTVRVTVTNDKPVVNVGPAEVTYSENAAPLLIASLAAVTDPDSADFNGGKLTISFASGVEASDRLTIVHQGNAAGQVGVDGNTLRFGNVIIGTFAINSASRAVTVSFNTAATRDAVQAVVRRTGFFSVSENPGTHQRSVNFVLTDGDTGTSDAVQKLVNVRAVNDAPVVTPGGGSANYTASQPAVPVAPAGTVTDPDSANFAGGKLTVNYQSGGEASDRLTVLHQGTGAGQVGVSGTSLTFGGTAIGTFSGGNGVTPLNVTFNVNATVAAVQAVLRRIGYSSVSATPGTQPRVVTFVLTDGDGGTSAASQRTVNVSAPAPGAFAATDGAFVGAGRWGDV